MIPRWLVALGFLGVGIASIATGAGTLAFFTGQATATGITLTSGTLELKLYDQENDRVVATLVSAIQHEGLFPGWTFENEPVILYNDGSLDLVTDLSAATEDPPGAVGMAAQLYLTLYDWTDTDGDGFVGLGETNLIWGPDQVLNAQGIPLGRIEDDFDQDEAITDAFEIGNPEQDFLVGADGPIATPAPADPHSGFKGLAFSWEFRSTGTETKDNSFQGKTLQVSLIFSATDQTVQEPS